MRERGLCLDSQLAYTRGAQALQHALLDVLTPGRSTCTLVARPAAPTEEPVVGQVAFPDGDEHARLTYLSPAEALEQPSSLRLLEALAEAAGERGAFHLIAEVDQDTAAVESLRRAGFGIYARQRIWRLRQAPASPPEAAGAWRPEQEADRPAIQALYRNLVPALVQQVEAPPDSQGRGLVHWLEEELLGYLEVHRGPRGVWVQPYFHPAAEDPKGLLAAFLAGHAAEPDRPWYICVRSYQGWLNAALEDLGFEAVCDQAVMVKRLAAAVRRPALAALPRLEATRPEATAPFAKIESKGRR